MILVGATYQSYDLIGKLLEPSRTFARQMGTALVVVALVVTMSALAIFRLTEPLDPNSSAVQGPAIPAERNPTPPDLVIEVRSNSYGFRADGDNATDLESLIARCREVISISPDRQVVVFAESDVPYSRIADVMSALTAAGVGDIQFATSTN